jgi:hypothetical protein
MTMLAGWKWDRRIVPALLVLAALWLLCHPWEGLWHDSRLYALQALQRLHPDQFRRDLFLVYGSQDAFTLFSPIYAALISALGLDTAALLVQETGNLLWLGSAAFLVAAFQRGLGFWLTLVLLVALPSDYGPTMTTFNLAETFPTPRIFAEALGMLAMGCAVRGRWPWGVPALVLALLLHPLMAAGVGLFGVLFLAEGKQRMRLTALAVVLIGAVLAGAALLGIAPFDRLLRTMDDTWYAHVLATTSGVAWDGWVFGAWASRAAVAFSPVLAAAWLGQGARARFFGCVALTGAAGLLACWVGTGLTHNLLMLQAQPWRVMWIVQMASAIALACLWQQFWHRGRLFRVLLLALCVAILTRNTFGGLLGLAAAGLLCHQGRQARPWELAPRHYRLALVLLAALASALLREIAGGPPMTGIWQNDIPIATFDNLWLWIWLKRGAAALLGVGVLVQVWRWSGNGRRAAAYSLALACLAVSAAVAIERADAAAWLAPETRQAVRANFLPLIPPQATVYWEDELRYTWFVLGRSSYGSNPQMAGAVFNRGTALEGRKRLARLEQLGMADGIRKRTRLENAEAVNRLKPTTLDGLVNACADPELDFVVLSRKLGPSVVATAIGGGNAFYLYDCSLLRPQREAQ